MRNRPCGCQVLRRLPGLLGVVLSLVGLPVLLRRGDPGVHARAAAVDLAGPQVHRLDHERVGAGAKPAAGAAARGREVLVHGQPGVISWNQDGTALSLMAFAVAGGRIAAITAVTDPARLAAMDLPES